MLFNLSPHQPVLLCAEAKCPYRNIKVGHDRDKPKYSWQKANAIHIASYRETVQRYIKEIHIDDEFRTCVQKGCNYARHLKHIDELCEAIITSCVKACEESIPCVKKKKGIPKWNEVAQPYRDTALFWHSIWVSCRKPNKGVVFEIRRKTRAEYHMVVKKLKRDEKVNRCERMAEAVLQNNSRNFWQEAKKMNGNVKRVPDTMDNTTGSKEIADLFGEKYCHLYNSVPFDAGVMKEIEIQRVPELMSHDFKIFS